MDPLQEKHDQLIASGWGADPPAAFAPHAVGDGFGTWFGWRTSSGVDVAIYHSPASPAAEVHGAILDEYRAQGGPQGRLGYPVTDEQDDVDDTGHVRGRVSEFQWGSVSWDRTTLRCTTMFTDPVVEVPNVAFRQFLDHGTGLVGHRLGEVDVFTVYGNGVELQFTVQPAVRLAFPTLRPIQWAGPSTIWLKDGPDDTSPWVHHRSSLGDGEDGPDDENVVSTPEVIAYYDSPGPDVLKFFDLRPSRIRAIQNFTGWVAGTPAVGGPEVRMCPVVAWYSIVDLVDTNWGTGASTPSWSRRQSRAALGWADTSSVPT